MRYEIQETVFQNVAPLAMVPGATVTVKDLRGENLAVYQGETGSAPLANPLTTDNAGRVEGWVEAPDFALTVTFGAVTYTHHVRMSPLGMCNVKSWGARGDGTTDDTAAIDAAWAHCIAVATGNYFAPPGGGSLAFEIGGPTLYFPAGRYVYNGTGLTNPASPKKVFRIEGDGRETTEIVLAAGMFFVNFATKLDGFTFRDLTIRGGAGAIRHTYPTVNVGGRYVVRDCNFWDYTGCAVQDNSNDMPYWEITGCQFWGLNFDATMGIALMGDTSGGVIERCDFLTNRVALKLSAGTHTSVKNCDFLRFGTGGASPRVGLWIVPWADNSGAGATSSGAAGFVCDGNNKFGGENVRDDDFHVLFAPEGGGTDNGSKFPDLVDAGKAITGAAATDVFTSAAHGFVNGDAVTLTALTGGAGLNLWQPYYVITATANTFQLTLTPPWMPSPPAVNFTTDVTATSTVKKWGVVSGQTYTNNSVLGGGAVNTVKRPFIYSMTPHVRALVVAHNSFPDQPPSAVIEFKDPLPPNPHNQNNVLGPNTSSQIGLTIDPATYGRLSKNARGAGYAPDPSGQYETQAGQGLPHPQLGGLDTTGYKQLLAGGLTNMFPAGTATKTATPDRNGGGDAATIEFLNGPGGDLIYYAADLLATATLGEPVWIEFDVMAAASSAIPGGLFEVAISYSGYGVDHWLKLIEIPAAWERKRFLWPGPREKATSVTFAFRPRNWRHATSQEHGKVIVGRPRVYQAREPLYLAGKYGEVASAAAITIPGLAEVVKVTGTTTITSIVAMDPGHRVTLIFAGALTVTDGSNLKLSADFITTADDTITLVCDGVNWHETGRSVN